jgi:chorismate lyase/3-hydroxybenzoate synthase
MSGPGLAVHYAATAAAAALGAEAHVLGMIGYGAARPAFAPRDVPFLSAPLAPLGAAPAFEIWTTDAPVRPFRIGPVAGMCSADLAFGGVRLEALPGERFDNVVERAYLAIFDFLAACGMSQPIRFWHYLTGILAHDEGLERYRHFNVGRHRALLARLSQALPPAASCVGGQEGSSVIYCLAARAPAKPVENPRQVSAYEYPLQYGPRSPSFSRAGLWRGRLFVSGTASIVGHESRHDGDLPAQLEETLANLRAVIGHAGMEPNFAPAAAWAYKIYLRDPADRARIAPRLDAVFGADAQKLYLQGEVCRADLLLEIEAFYSGDV